MRLDTNDFLQRLMRSPAGEKVMAERDKEILQKRNEAAAQFADGGDLDTEIDAVDREMQAKRQEVERLAAALVRAQEESGSLAQKKARLQNRQNTFARKARKYLEETSPRELLHLIGLCRHVKYGARYRATRPSPPDTSRITGQKLNGQHHAAAEARQEARVLLARADRVYKAARALILKPDCSLADVERLGAELAAPDDMLAAWEGRPLDQRRGSSIT
jgi:hypothetical protein